MEVKSAQAPDAAFHGILSEMKEAKTQKKITYELGYSNFAFELWMVLHKRDCNGPLNHRKQYLGPICQVRLLERSLRIWIITNKRVPFSAV